LNSGLITGSIEDRCRNGADRHDNCHAYSGNPHFVFITHLISLPSDVGSYRFWQIDPGSPELLAQDGMLLLLLLETFDCWGRHKKAQKWAVILVRNEFQLQD
jgi:hypothetical protein